MSRTHGIALSMIGAVGLAAGIASAQPGFTFATGDPDGKMAVASRPESTENIEIEAADDFIVTTEISLSGVRFQGLIPLNQGLETVASVTIEIYRVFPLDSDTTRQIHVPTRNNSPSDNAFEVRNAEFVLVEDLGNQFAAGNSVLDGIHPSPAQNTQGDGPVTGRHVRITADMQNAIDLPPGHYFVVPQVQLTSGQFFWLSAPRPIVAPGTPFLGDLQAWVRNANLDPDWLRVGADIVGGNPAPAFNMSLELIGQFACYPNCDGSSVTPSLNANDFQCFLNAFAAGSPYANCDASRVPPVLNANDFQCFMNAFAAGCS